MSYVKNYSVGDIRIDIPYKHIIHKLPLLSFGDVQHTINLSLVFQSKTTENAFNISQGYKFNLLKRLLLSSGGTPEYYEDENGVLTRLISCDDRFMFDDDSQRIIRKLGNTFILENPDFSFESYDNYGRIAAVYDSYRDSQAYLTYYYAYGKVETITYRNDKVLKFNYNPDSGMVSSVEYICLTESTLEDTPTPTHPTISFSYSGNANVTVNHYSGVSYCITYNSNEFQIYSLDSEANASSVSHKIVCAKTSSGYIIEKFINSQKIDTATYEFVASQDENKFNLLDITNNNGVTTRIQLENDKVAYSYEVTNELSDPRSNNDIKYTGTVTMYNNNDVAGYQSFTDGMRMGDDGNNGGPHSIDNTENASGYFVLSGWINAVSTDACTIRVVDSARPVQEFCVQCEIPIIKDDTWQYFAFGFKGGHFQKFTASVENPDTNTVLLRDLRLTFQEGATPQNHLSLMRDVLILEDSLGYDEKYFSLDDNYEFYNGDTIIAQTFSGKDLLKYKLNQAYGSHKNEIYFNDCRGIITNADTLYMHYIENNTVYSIPVTQLAVGTKSFNNGKTHVAKTNFYTVDGITNLITTSSVNGSEYKKDVFNDNYDLVSSTTEGVTTTYVRNAKGLVTSEVVACENAGVISSKNIVYDDTITKIESITDELGATIEYETDDVWGVVTGVTVKDANNVVKSVITDAFDDDKCTLLSREFANGTDPRKTTLEYSAGNVSKITHGISNKSINFGFAYSHDALEEITRYNITKCNTAIEENALTNGDKVLTTSYPNATNPIYTVVQRTDKYGRLTKIDGLIQNEYDISPEFSDTEGYTVREIDNGSGRLASTTDLITNNTTKYAYKNGKVSKIGTFNASNTKISEESFLYDGIGRLTYDTFTYDVANGKTVGAEMSYVKGYNDPLADGRIEAYSYKINGESKAITNVWYDPFKRVNSKHHYIGGRYFSKDITFENTRPKTLVDKTNATEIGNTSYTYDAMGRIATVAANGYTTLYTYDAYGQLVKEEIKNTNGTIDKTIQYVYNGIGNIDSVTTTYSSGSSSAQSFTYGDTTHPDRLTAFNGNTIGYNSIGCPISYDGKTLGWTNGKLTSITEGSAKDLTLSYESHSYTYNALGQRTSKTYFYRPSSNFAMIGNYLRNTNTNYTYDNSGRLIREKRLLTYSDFSTLAIEFIYLYDESGIIGVQFMYGDEAPQLFYYQRNLQGDVVAIYNTSGVLQASYSYNTWGDCTVANSTNARIANYNPIRYRGYYLDTETNWYFLNARYYSPEWRRFVSPSNVSALNPQAVNGINLYCYCGNNPIIYIQNPISSDYSIVASPILVGRTTNIGGNTNAGMNSTDWISFWNYIGGMFSTYTDYSRKIIKSPPLDLVLFGYEQGIIDTNIVGNASAPIALFTKVAEDWWKIWEYQSGIKSNIGDYSCSFSRGLVETNVSFALGNSSLDFTTSIFRIGIGTSHTVDDNTVLYNQVYIKPVDILIILVAIKYAWPFILKLLEQGQVPKYA